MPLWQLWEHPTAENVCFGSLACQSSCAYVVPYMSNYFIYASQVTVWGLSAGRGECLTSLSKHPALHIFLKCLIQTAKVCFYQASASFLINKSERDSRLRFQPPPPPQSKMTGLISYLTANPVFAIDIPFSVEMKEILFHDMHYANQRRTTQFPPPTSRLPQTLLWHPVINHYTNSLLTVAFGNRALLIGHLVP